MAIISVIIPVYNVEKYIKKCIESVLHQSFIDLELILVDDGSTDSSGEICDNYAEIDSRIKVIHKSNSGVSSARNTGLDEASGEYFFFVDSDDYLHSDCLKNLFNVITLDDVDLVSMDYYIVDDNQAANKISFTPIKICINDFEEKFMYITKNLLQGKHPWNLWTNLYKAEIIRENSIRICETCENFAEDLAFNLAYLMHCNKICNIDYAGYYYYQRDNSMMHKSLYQIKLNALNEVSYFYFFYLISNFKNTLFVKQYPLIHFWIMQNQYVRFIEMNSYKNVSIECKKIIRRSHYYKFTFKSLFFRKEIEEIYSRDKTFEYLNLCFYTLHKCYNIFKYVSGCYYKWIKKRT